MTDCRIDFHSETAEKAKAHMLNEETLVNLCKIYKTIGEPSRMKIILSLIEGDMCVYHICESTGLKQSLTSHQLSVLKQGNIIKSRREGQNIIYSIADGHIKSIIEMSLIHLKCL